MELELMISRFQADESIVAEYIRRMPGPRQAVARWNQEFIPVLVPPPNFGNKVHIGSLGKAITMKMHYIGGWIAFDDSLVVSLNATEIVQKFVSNLTFQLSSMEKTYGYMARPRNYYLVDLFEIWMSSRYDLHQTRVGWKCPYVVLPRSFRKKLWKLRRR